MGLGIVAAMALPIGISSTQAGALICCGGGGGTTPALLDAASGQYYPVAPFNVVDTRIGLGLPTSGQVPANGSITFVVDGYGGIPGSGVSAVFIDIGALNPTAIGWLSAYPSDSSDPNIASVGFQSNQSAQGSSTVQVSSYGAITITNHSSQSVDVVANVRGYFASTPLAQPGDLFEALTPSTVLDTRTGVGMPNNQAEVLGAGQSLTVPVALPSTLFDAAAIEIGAIGASASGFLVDYGTQGGTSSPAVLTYQATEKDRVEDFIQPNIDGNVIIVNKGSGSLNVQVILDGYFMSPSDVSGGSAFYPMSQTQIVSLTTVQANSSLTFNVLGVGGIPSQNVTGLSAEVDATSPQDSGWLSLSEAGTGNNNLAIVNFVGGDNTDVTLNEAIAASYQDHGELTIYNDSAGSVRIQVSVLGYYLQPSVPGAAQGLDAQDSVTNGVNDTTVSWSPPTEDGGNGVVAYSVTSVDDNDTQWINGNAYSAVFEGEPVGDAYSIEAFNWAGGGPSIQSGVPEAPQLSDPVSGDGSLSVSLSAAPDGGHPVATSTVTITDASGNVLGTQTIPGDQGTVTFSPSTGYSLSDGELYSLSAVSSNTAGVSQEGAEVSAAPAPQTSVPVSTVTSFNLMAPPAGSSATLSAAAAANTASWSLGTDSSSNDYETLYQPDLSSIPPYSQILSASLTIGGGNVNTESPQLSAYALDSPVTGSSSITALNSAVDTTVEVDGGMTSSNSLDLTDAVQGWIDGTAPSDGFVLEAATSNGALVDANGPAAGSYQPSLLVTYLAPVIPPQPQTLTATAGDGGALLQWTNSNGTGSDAPVSNYQVTVTDNSTGLQVYQGSVSDYRTFVSGLNDTDTYSASVADVTSANPSIGAPATVTFTPVSAGSLGQSATTSVSDYIAADTGLDNQSYSSPAAAAASVDPGDPSAVQGLLTNGDDPAAGAGENIGMSIVGEVVVPSSGSAGDVYATVELTATNPDGSQYSETALYDIAYSIDAQSNAQLNAITNLDEMAATAYQDDAIANNPGIGTYFAGTNASSNFTQWDLSQPLSTPSLTDSLTQQSGCGSACSTYAGGNAASLAATYATQFSVVPSLFGDDCTSFASFVMAYNWKAPNHSWYGGKELISAVNWKYAHGAYKNEGDPSLAAWYMDWKKASNYGDGSHVVYSQTWSVAAESNDFIQAQGTSFGEAVERFQNSQILPGDIIYWEYSCGDPGTLTGKSCQGHPHTDHSIVLHTQVVTAVASASPSMDAKMQASCGVAYAPGGTSNFLYRVYMDQHSTGYAHPKNLGCVYYGKYVRAYAVAAAAKYGGTFRQYESILDRWQPKHQFHLAGKHQLEPQG